MYENQRPPPIDIAWALMTSDCTRRTSCALQDCVRTLLRVTPLGVAMNWMRKASTAAAAWKLSSVSTSKMLFQSKNQQILLSGSHRWSSRVCCLKDLCLQLSDSLLLARGCESHGFFLYLLLVPYFLHPRHISFFIIVVMEIKIR